MTKNSWSRMAVAMWVGVILLALPGAATAAEDLPAPEPMGNDTYSLTRRAGFAFIRNTAKLEKEARMDAIEFCAGLGRKMKEVSMTSKKASPILGGISQATLIFKALDPADPEATGLPAPGSYPLAAAAHAPGAATNAPTVAPPAPALAIGAAAYAAGVGDLDRLAGLHDRKLLSDSEFADAKRRVKEATNDRDLLVELQRKGVLTDAEFEAAQRRLAARAP